VPNLFTTLCAYNLAANMAYALTGDAAFADGIRLQYLKKLEECKRLYPIEWRIQDAYKSISVLPYS
jgi:hypothetical protein